MKKITFILGIIITTISCSEKKEPVKPHTKLENFIIEFSKNNPNTFNNNITKENSTINFIGELSKFLKSYDSSFYFEPVKFNGIVERNGSQMYGMFSVNDEEITRKEEKPNISINSDIVVKISRTQVDTLVEGRYYQIIGKFKTFKELNMDQQLLPIILGYKNNQEFSLGTIELIDSKINSISWREKMILKGKINK
jgi:hypothetical protein